MRSVLYGIFHGGAVKLVIIVIFGLITLLGVFFITLNTVPVRLDYYFGKTELSLSALIVICLVVGAILGLLAVFGNYIRIKRANTRMKKDIQLLQEEVYNLRRLPLRDKN